MNRPEFIFLVLVVVLSQMTTTISLRNIMMTLAEIKVGDVEKLRDLRQKALAREVDLKIINGDGNPKDVLYDPFFRLNDSSGHPSVVWLTSYGGDPVSWEVVFFALMPIVLAKVIRSTRNFFRPTLHLRQGITDFPLVPLIYLQQTKLEQRVKREKRNGIDWLGKKFLIRASDNFVDIKEVKHQPTQKVVPKNPWALLRFMTKFNVVYQHAHTKHEHENDNVPASELATGRAPVTPSRGSGHGENLKTKKSPLLAKILELGRAEKAAEASKASEVFYHRRKSKVTFSSGPKPETDTEDEEEEYDEEEGRPMNSAPKYPSKEHYQKNLDKSDVHRKTSVEVISEKPKPEGQGQRRQSADKEIRPKPPELETIVVAEERAPMEPEPELPYHIRQLKDFMLPREKKQERKGSDREDPSSPESDNK